jgi:DeoR/GlpR family transcriptional regulator of sugar metabolism
VAFVAPGGISEAWGVTEYMNNELPLEKRFLELADTAYIVAEHQKFDRKCMLKVCDFGKVKGIITDSQCPDDIVARYRDIGVAVYRADPL